MTRTVILSERAKDEAIREITNAVEYMRVREFNMVCVCYGSATVWEDLYEEASCRSLYDDCETYKYLLDQVLEYFEENNR